MTILQQFLNKVFIKENICYLLITVFCTRYILIDTRAGVSMFKVAVAALTPFIFILSKPAISKPVVLSAVYFAYIFITAFFHPTSFRISTILYLLSFLMSFCTLYHLIYVNKSLCIDNFIIFVRYAIIASTFLLIAQQIFIVFGIKTMPILNLTQILNRGIGANSLYGEPSVFARVMCVLFYAYIKCNEYRTGAKMSILSISSPGHRCVTIAFLWSMLTMGSGTAFICLGVLSLYFMRGWQFIYAIPIFIGVYFTMDFFEVKQFNRAVSAAQATMTGDAQEVAEADGSASVRIAPLLNTFNMDFSEVKAWFGEGCDTSLKYRHTNNRYIGEINDYGLIAYILGLILVFTCAIKPVSLATMMFFMGIGGGTSNIPYAWGLLMLMTCVRYFSETYQLELCKRE